MKIGVMGTGVVGTALSEGFLKHGHSVMRGTREPGTLADWKKSPVGTMAKAAAFGEIVVLAVKGTAAEEAVALCGGLAGKVVIDATNPIADRPPGCCGRDRQRSHRLSHASTSPYQWREFLGFRIQWFSSG